MDSNRGAGSDAEVATMEGSPSEAVVTAVADVAGVDAADLPPLYEAIDPDALDAVFENRPEGTVTFEYDSYTVTVRTDEDGVTVRVAS